jgi:hypothetical protein
MASKSINWADIGNDPKMAGSISTLPFYVRKDN